MFSIVWALLYIMFGISWVIANRNCDNKIICNLTYILTTLFLCLWIVFYGCKKNKKQASWVLLISLMLVLMCFSQGNYLSKILLAPLIGWVIFALLMNTTEVQNGF
jgi:tryptophan-rich sensory protein